MRFMRLLPILGLAASTATAQIISIPGLDLSLLEDVRRASLPSLQRFEHSELTLYGAHRAP